MVNMFTTCYQSKAAFCFVPQVMLCRAMVAAGELSQAEELRDQFGLPADSVSTDPSEAAEQAANRAAGFLALPIPPERVFFVDTDAGVSE